MADRFEALLGRDAQIVDHARGRDGHLDLGFIHVVGCDDNLGRSRLRARRFERHVDREAPARADDPGRVARRQQETHDVWTLELEPDGDMHFAPGQFNMLYVLGVGEVPISMSGDPSKPGFIHTIRGVGAVSEALTALEPGEIIESVYFPKPKSAAYMKFSNPASRYAIVGVFVAQTGNGVRVAVTGAGACAFRVPEMEKALAARFAPDAIAGITVAAAELNADMHASAGYRAHLVTVMAKRAVEKVLAG